MFTNRSFTLAIASSGASVGSGVQVGGKSVGEGDEVTVAEGWSVGIGGAGMAEGGANVALGCGVMATAAVGLFAGFTGSPICREQPASKNSAVTAAVKTPNHEFFFPSGSPYRYI